MVIVSGGTVLVQAILQTLIAFGINITPAQNAALMTLSGVLLPLLARQYSTPNHVVEAKIADATSNIVTANAALTAQAALDTATINTLTVGGSH
jgi:hypothetical protein